MRLKFVYGAELQFRHPHGGSVRVEVLEKQRVHHLLGRAFCQMCVVERTLPAGDAVTAGPVSHLLQIAAEESAGLFKKITPRVDTGEPKGIGSNTVRRGMAIQSDERPGTDYVPVPIHGQKMELEQTRYFDIRSVESHGWRRRSGFGQK